MRRTVHDVLIRPSNNTDRVALDEVHLAAFGQGEGPEIIELVNALANDPTAKPLLSLVAETGGRVIGHILFTSARLQSTDQVKASLLAPMAVLPNYQKGGVGKTLINSGLSELRASGFDLVFVLGHPGYYPRFGFRPAGVRGYDAPYPIPSKNADAWMVKELSNGVHGTVRGTVVCADVLNVPELWRE